MACFFLIRDFFFQFPYSSFIALLDVNTQGIKCNFRVVHLKKAEYICVYLNCIHMFKLFLPQTHLKVFTALFVVTKCCTELTCFLCQIKKTISERLKIVIVKLKRYIVTKPVYLPFLSFFYLVCTPIFSLYIISLSVCRAIKS